jgi:hypothetical protein
MSTTETLPDDFAATRADLQRVATHVLARARAAHGGRFGLRVTPTGLATLPFGDDDSVLRLAGSTLVVEQQHADGVTTRTLSLAGASLAEAAAFAGTSLAEPFAPGADAPPVGDVDAPLRLDAASLHIVLDWYVTGARVLDAVLPRLDTPTAAQLWPEHFDLGMSATAGSGGVNLGASPGDRGVAEPYLYVAPWTADRPGDPDFWNVDYGAVATRSTLLAAGDPVTAGVAFVTRGLGLLGTA